MKRNFTMPQGAEPIEAAAIKAGELVQVLQKFASTTPGVFLYHPSQRQMLPKLRASSIT